MTQKIVWVLTREHNEYDQHGEYFVAVFGDKPTLGELADFMAKQEDVPHFGKYLEAVAFIEHLLTGGGRRNEESVWFHLRAVEVL